MNATWPPHARCLSFAGSAPSADGLHLVLEIDGRHRQGGDHANAPNRALRPESLRPLALTGEPGEIGEISEIGPTPSARTMRELAAPASRCRRRPPPRRTGPGAALTTALAQASSAQDFAARTARCQRLTARAISSSDKWREKRRWSFH